MDVIVCTVQGDRRLLDFLAGGKIQSLLIPHTHTQLEQVIMTVTPQLSSGRPILSGRSQMPMINIQSNLKAWTAVSLVKMKRWTHF